MSVHIWMDCSENGYAMYRYNAQRDQGNQPRKKSFSRDKNVPKNCQQKSTKTYFIPKHQYVKGMAYDRGHGVSANVMDNDKSAIKATNFMTNIVPQASKMNHKGGAWFRTEQIEDFYRDKYELLVLGGAIYKNNDTSNDYFVK